MKKQRHKILVAIAFTGLLALFAYYWFLLQPLQNQFSGLKLKKVALERSLKLTRQKENDAKRYSRTIVSMNSNLAYSLQRLQAPMISDVVNTCLTLAKTLQISVDAIAPDSNQHQLTLSLKTNYLHFLKFIEALKFLPWILTIKKLSINTEKTWLNIKLTLGIMYEAN